MKTKIKLKKLIKHCQDSMLHDCKNCECDFKECFTCLKEIFQNSDNEYNKDV